MNDVHEYGCNPSDEIYATQDDFGPATPSAEPVEELPFHIPRD
jgi:hypothetical protein